MSYKRRAIQHQYAELRKQKKLEKQLLQNTRLEEEQMKLGISKRNRYGIRDLTPYNAFLLINNGDRVDDIVFK